MKNSVKLWAEIIPSPIKGFSKVDESTKIILPIIVILLLALTASFLLVPVLSSDAYTDALMRVQINTMEERGTELSTEQIELMNQQLSSGSIKKITLLSSTIGGVIGYAAMTLVTVLLLKLFTLIAKEKITIKMILKIVVYIAIISTLQMLIKNFITVFTDYERILARVQETSELQYALSSAVSLAALLDPGKISGSLYYLIDALTDIFNWLYYGYLFAGLKAAAGLSTGKAVKITIAAAVIMTGVGLVIVALV